MSDETVKDENAQELNPNATQAELKAAADEILKAAKTAEPAPEVDADSDADDAGDAVEEPVELTVEQQMLALEVEKQELRDQMLRAMAEMENLRKRSEREKSDARVYAIEKFARDLLSVSDNMARALEALPEDEREALTDGGKGLLGGIEMTQKELHTVLTLSLIHISEPTRPY